MTKILKISAVAALLFVASSANVSAKISSQDTGGVTVLQGPSTSAVPDGGATAVLLGASALALLAARSKR